MPTIYETTDAAGNTGTTYSLQVGQTAQGQLSSGSDHDFFRVTLVAGQTYTVAMTGTGVSNVVDPYLRVYAANGSTLIASNDDGLPGGNSIVTFTASTSGTYYIDAGSYNNVYSGQYGVAISQGTKVSLDVQMGAGVLDTDYSWSATPGTGANVTYGFRQNPASYTVSGSNIATFTQLSAAEIAAAEQILQMWSEVCNLTFTRVNPSGYTDSATILFANYNDPSDGAGAFAYYPGSTASNSAAGDVWLNTGSVNVNSLPLGGYSYFTIIHELGHAIGLSHAGQYNAAPGVSITYANNAQYVQDSHQYTVMSYFDESATGANLGGYPETLMMLDIYAAQQIYGVNMSTRSGNTTYGFGSNAGAVYDFTLNPTPALCIWDGGGIDTLNCSGFTQNQTINLADGSFSNVGGRTANVSIALNAIIENAVGGTGNDAITGNNADNLLSGGAGNDTLTGGAGHDRLDGGSGNDGMIGGLGDDTYVVDSSLDSVIEQANEGTDTVLVYLTSYYAGSNIENLTAALAVGQTLTGNSLNNVLTGNIGNDLMFGGDGSDTLVGGDGNDTLVGHSAANQFIPQVDILSGGNGNDTLYGEAVDILDGGAGFDVLQVISSYDMNVDLAIASIEYVVSDFGNDRYDASATTGGVEVYGSGGNDTLIGGSGNDRLWGGIDDDVLTGNDGDDTLVGDLGADRLSGGNGNDRLYVDASDTLIDGGAGNDVVYIIGGAGISLNLGASSLEYIVDMVGGNDVIDGSGQSLAITVFSGGGSDSVIGGSAGDMLWGGAGNDTIAGRGGNDRLIGEAGADRLNGGSGNDILYGGADADTFVWTTGGNTDTIVDWEDGLDRIEFSQVAGLDDIADLTIASSGGNAEIFFGASKLFIVFGAAGLIGSADLLFS